MILEKNILLVLLSVILVFSISGVYADSNADKLVSVEIHKIVNNDHGGTKTAQDFSFNLEYVTQNGSYIKHAIQIGNSGYRDWGFAEIPIGSIYKVTEVPSPDYYTEYEYDCSGIVKEEGAMCVIINNEKSPLKEEDFKGLEIQKIVNNDNGGTKTAKDFSFNLEITNPNGTKTTYAIQFQLWPYIDTSIPIGTPYTITEDPSPDYTAMYFGDCSGIVKEDSHCTIVNHNKTPKDYVDFKGLEIYKIVNNDNGGTKTAKDFSFNLEFINQNGSYSKQVIPFAPRGSTYESDLPIGATFKVTEDPSPDYTTKYVGDCFGIVKTNSYCTVVNSDKPNSTQATRISTGLNPGQSMNEIKKSTMSSADSNKQCQIGFGTGAYYDPAQDACLPPGGDWTNPGTAYLTLQCQTSFGTGAYYDPAQDACLPPGGDWTNPGTAYLTLQCQTNYGEGMYYDATQKICLPPSGSWVTQTTATTTCPDGETLDPVTNKCTNTELTSNQVTISNDALISIYTTSKQYEKATSSLLALNINQENALHGLTESNWYKDSADTNNAVHAQVVDLMIEKQSIDKKNIQNVSDWMKKISDQIKEYAQKQGVEPSILEQIDSTTQYEDNSRNASPVVGLRQSADAANINMNFADNQQVALDSKKVILTPEILGFILGKDSVVEQFRFLTQDGIWKDDPSLVQMAQTVLKEHRDELSKSEIEFINSYLEPFVPPVSPNENFFDQIGKYMNSLNDKEQNETDSILNQISDSGMLELSPIEKNHPQSKNDTNEPSILTQIEPSASIPGAIQLQSKHGTYEPSASSNSQSELYDVFVTWVLKSQNGAEYKTAHMLVTNHQTGSIAVIDLPIVDGVIQFNATIIVPGIYDYELTKIDGLAPPVDNKIVITIPNRQIENVTPPSTVQSTPNIPSTPPQDMPALSVPQHVTQEATSSSGAIVQFTVDKASPIPATITCDHESGSQFPIGNTVVTCTASGETGEVKKSFTVTVQDTTPPAISPFNPHNDTPDDSGAVVYFTAEAIDLVDGSVPVHCDHESGTKFSIGTTIITCTADDSKGNHSERKLSITITKS